MKEAKIIYVIISIICVISIIIGVYEQFFNKKDDNTNISTNGKVEEPIEQIKERHYASKINEFADSALYVGINYDPKTKEHECIIEEVEF